MKIGTVSIHLPFNYGNALQMLSLHKYLLEQGYDTEVLSHWFMKNRQEIRHLHVLFHRPGGALRFLSRAVMWGGVVAQYQRERKIEKWLQDKISWSTETGYDSHFDSDGIPFDVVIAGSDQIWNPKYETSRFFLLPTFPDHIKKIAYAASFGTDVFPAEAIPYFSQCLNRFSAISVRESSGVSILKGKFGREATLVCDPTLLHSRDEWARILEFKIPAQSKASLTMYLVTPSSDKEWKEVLRVARESQKRVDLFVFRWSQWLPKVNVRHPWRSFCLALSNIYVRVRLYSAGVRMHLSATPTEFVRSIAESSGVITDSFHGMMFATIFEKPCNVLVGSDEERLQMSARLRNFTEEFGIPEILTPRADIHAMRKLSVGPKLRDLIEFSKKWLAHSIDT